MLPTFGVLVRLVIVGGGGCGKSRIINQVLSPLLTCYYGVKGVMKEAGSNKASRLIGGMTMHMANGLQGNSSLLTPHLRLTPAERRRAESRYLGGAHSGFSPLEPVRTCRRVRASSRTRSHPQSRILSQEWSARIPSRDIGSHDFSATSYKPSITSSARKPQPGFPRREISDQDSTARIHSQEF